MKKRILSTLLLALFAAGSVQAIPLSALFQGASITAGDKLFDRWSLGLYDTSDSLRSLNAANIEVTALNDGGLNPGPGLSFTVINNELGIFGDGTFAYIDLKFGFHASVLVPGLAIKDNSLVLTSGQISLSGDNGFYIRETIGTVAGASDLGTKKVEFSFLDPNLISDLSDSAVFAPNREIWVTKNILVWATNDIEFANLTGFEQRFSQVAIPEPATLALTMLALAGVGLSRRKAS